MQNDARLDTKSVLAQWKGHATIREGIEIENVQLSRMWWQKRTRPQLDKIDSCVHMHVSKARELGTSMRALSLLWLTLGA